MILDPNGMPILQPTVDNAETATFNDAFAAIGNTRQIKTYKWADNAARTAQTGMVAGDEGYQTDTDTAYRYDGTAWVTLNAPPQIWDIVLAIGVLNTDFVNVVTRTGNVATIAARIQNGSGLTMSTSFQNAGDPGTLPDWARPANSIANQATIVGTGAGAVVQLEADGRIRVASTSSVCAFSFSYPV